MVINREGCSPLRVRALEAKTLPAIGAFFLARHMALYDDLAPALLAQNYQIG
jgi:hypothetical protein